MSSRPVCGRCRLPWLSIALVACSATTPRAPVHAQTAALANAEALQSAFIQTAERVSSSVVAIRIEQRATAVVRQVADLDHVAAERFERLENARKLAERAAKAGASGLMVVPSMVYHTNREETLAALRAVADASDLPIMIYSNRLAYRVDVTNDMLLELAEVGWRHMLSTS